MLSQIKLVRKKSAAAPIGGTAAKVIIFLELQERFVGCWF